MNFKPSDPINRRTFVQQTTAIAAAALAGELVSPAADQPKSPSAPAFPHPFITAAKDFYDVSRGEPRPHKLTDAARIEARLTADTWRLEITADAFVEPPNIKLPATLESPRTIAENTALDLPTLVELGKQHEVKFLKAMQCLNIASPLGQGLWAGVPLRDVLLNCGKMTNVRRIYFWGYHNNDPKQIFQSSVSYADAFETPPGELPVFIAYRLNDEPISPERGGPVRMIVPWAHGFKSIKWLQHIFVTNDYRINDTYALQNNDPESHLKTAAYVDKGPDKIKAGDPVFLTGQVIVGRSGLQRVEYWLRAVDDQSTSLADDDAELLRGPWSPCQIEREPIWTEALPKGISIRDVLGFDKQTGKPLSWPLPYSMLSYSATLNGLKLGKYELRARSIDLNDFAQPEPRPAQKNGKNAIMVRHFSVA